MSDMNSPWRADFPVLQTLMYDKPLAFLDSGASAQKPQVVIDAMDSVLECGYSNIHRGLYSISQDLTTSFEGVRTKVARFINAPRSEDIVFTKNTTEAINLVAQSWGRTSLKQGDEVIITEMEHHANIVPWMMLSQQIGITVKTVPVTEHGLLDLEAFTALLSSKTKLVGFVEISNVLGTVNPVDKIVDITRSYNPDIKILIDGSQGIVHHAVDVEKIDADFYVFTGHKLYGPSGVGVLYGRTELLEEMPPYQGGGDMVERVSFKDGITYRQAPAKFEAGTPAIVEVIGLGAAIDYLTRIGMDNIIEHEKVISNYAYEQLSSIQGLKLYGPNDIEQKAGIFSFTLENIHASDIGMILDQCGVAVRIGHHCAMPLMEALGVDATVRASIGLYTNKADIDQFIEAIKKVQDLFG